MSRLVSKPIFIPKGAVVSMDENFVLKVKTSAAADGRESSFVIPKALDVDISEEKISFKINRDVLLKDKGVSKEMFGTVYRNINNFLLGAKGKFSKKVTLKGVGFKVAVLKDKLEMTLGFSHDPYVVNFASGIEVSSVSQTEFLVSSYSKEILGSFLAMLKSVRPVEPYQGKGVGVEGERYVRKEVKKKK